MLLNLLNSTRHDERMFCYILYSVPKQVLLERLYGFICDFFEFPLLECSKILTVHGISYRIRMLNTKKQDWSRQHILFCKFMSCTIAESLADMLP